VAPVVAAVALGSNLGDRRSHLDFAVSRLHQLLVGLRVSSYRETAPFGVSGGQPGFLNAAVVGESGLGARELIDRLLTIEAARGRARPYPKAPRTLDLDLVLLGSAIIDDGVVAVPHPRFRERTFVLEPLAEIAPDLIDPVTGRSIDELLARLRQPDGQAPRP
jgi:2-amino-4-hydroxy-6-hydroxymethyldihydropteridine diphosphokinase